jgi:branched-chain amino acid transport system permease protein
MEIFFQQLVNGLSVGSIYALIALGYTMVYGVLKLINFAHSEVFMVGAFAGYYAALGLGFDPAVGSAGFSVLFVVLVFLAAMLASAALGMTIERVAYRPLRGSGRKLSVGLLLWGIVLTLAAALVPEDFEGRMAVLVTVAVIAAIAAGAFAWFVVKDTSAGASGRLAPLITAIGVSLLLQNVGILAFGAEPERFPEIIAESRYEIGGVVITNVKIVIFVVSILLMVGLTFFVQRTWPGKAMRALAVNIPAAQLMGINVGRSIAVTFAIGSSLAAAGGILFGLDQTQINPLMGVLIGLKAFVAAVLGGIGNSPGAVLGGILIGVAEQLTAGYLSTDYKDAITFVILIGVLILRPEGLLGTVKQEKV